MGQGLGLSLRFYGARVLFRFDLMGQGLTIPIIPQAMSLRFCMRSTPPMVCVFMFRLCCISASPLPFWFQRLARKDVACNNRNLDHQQGIDPLLTFDGSKALACCDGDGTHRSLRVRPWSNFVGSNDCQGLPTDERARLPARAGAMGLGGQCLIL